jgi:hypothetical protein
MSSDQIQPERDFYRTLRSSAPVLSGRAWVKRDFHFWYRCTIEDCLDDGILVTLDNMDEATVQHDDVKQLDLEPGDLVFVQQWNGSLSGNPAFVVALHGETVDVEYPTSLYGTLRDEVLSCLLRDLRIYCSVPLTDWQKGTRVFAYKSVQFDPPLFLFFPATVNQVHFEVCVEVEFDDGETAVVPTTLIEPLKIGTGDTVHTCTMYQTSAASYTGSSQRWGPCRVVNRIGDSLTLEDGVGAPFEAHISMIAKLPSGYQMNDGKLEKIAAETSAAFRSISAMPAQLARATVHIVRSDHWLDAAEQPIARGDIDDLLAADSELKWSSDAGLSGDDQAQNILWNGLPCFWWNRNGISCSQPNESQLAKMIEMAIELDANVIGEDGHVYH